MDEQNLSPDQKKAVDEFKALPKNKGGRPVKEFGPLLKIAASVLKDSGLSYREIALELGTKPETVKKALLRGSDIKIDIADLNKVREGFSAHIAGIIQKMLMAANSDEYVQRLMQTKNAALIIGMATLIDKLQVLNGKPTTILETRDMAAAVDQKMKEIEELEKILSKPSDTKQN